MGSPSKENQILELLFNNSPLKHWQFKEFIKQTKMTRAAINKWLNKYQQEGLLKKIKNKGKFPYFTVGSNNPTYKSAKRIYGLNKLYKIGLIKDLIKMEEIKTIIIFGSIAKGDWYKDSDIDIFIYGNPKAIKKYKYQTQRDIELHVFKTKKEIKKVKTGLIENVINGHIIKGQIQDFAEIKI